MWATCRKHITTYIPRKSFYLRIVKITMSKGLQALNDNLSICQFENIEKLSEYLSNHYIVEKELKSLDILRNKCIENWKIRMSENYEDYENNFVKSPIEELT